MELWVGFCGRDAHGCPTPLLTALWRGCKPAESGVSGEGAACRNGRLLHGRKDGVEEGKRWAGGEPPAGSGHERYTGRVQGLPLGAPLPPVCWGEEHHWWTGRSHKRQRWGVASSASHLLLLSNSRASAGLYYFLQSNRGCPAWVLSSCKGNWTPMRKN